MQIVVNGQSVEVASSNLSEILIQLGYQADEVVVAHNLAFIPRTDWSEHSIDEHDTLDVLTAVVGG